MIEFAGGWWWLLALPAVPLLAWAHVRSYARLDSWARSTSVLIRVAMIAAILAALSNPTWFQSNRAHHVVFVLDVSASVSSDNVDAALETIDTLSKDALGSPGARSSVVAFGEHPTLLRSEAADWQDWTDQELDRLHHRRRLEALQRELAAAIGGDDEDGRAELVRRIDGIETFVQEQIGEHTNLERALRLAGNLTAAGRHATIYLISDGAANLGQWRRAIPDRTSLRVLALDRPEPPEVLAASIATPQHVRVHQTFTPRLTVTSNVETGAMLRVFVDGFAVEQRRIELERGDTHVDLAGRSFDTKGFHSIQALIEPEDDTRLANNAVSTLVVVPGKARVLYVDAEEQHIPHLKTALELEGFDVDARPAAGVPQDLAELLSYDALILSNIPSDRLGTRQMQMIRTYVRDFGGGFVMLGGDESFGLGGYFQTPIEDVLPVRMPIQKDLTRPSLALFLVIDKSGSMDGVKIQLAKRAALATAEVINPRDQIGVIGFDGASRVLLPLTPALDRARIRSSVDQLQAGGGTFLYPALQDAQRGLNESAARRKHILVLSDGQTQGFGYDQLVREISADGITVSTIGIGQGADMNLMETMAANGGGRVYFTNDFFTIPQIFTREALRAANNMLIERLVAPIAIDDDPALEEIDADDLPLLTGYVATTPKAAADVPIVSETGDPLLARWRYGLGRSVAFTSETKPRWAEDWLDWPQFTKFWGQLIRSITGDDLDASFTLLPSHIRSGIGVDLMAEIEDDDGEFVDDAHVELTAFAPDGQSLPIDVTQDAPGRFKAHLPAIEYGDEHRFVWTAQVRGSEPIAVSYAMSYPYSPELATLGGNPELLQAIATHASTSVVSIEDNVDPATPSTSTRRLVLWPALLTLAVMLIPLDILVRRLG